MARLTPIRLALLQDDRSQKWLADQVGVTESVMSRVVNGLIPDDQLVDDVCRVLGRAESVLFPHLNSASDHIPVAPAPSTGLAA
jgi:hypothetical protein